MKIIRIIGVVILSLFVSSLAAHDVSADYTLNVNPYYGSSRYIWPVITGTSPIDCSAVYVRVFSDTPVNGYQTVDEGYAQISTSTGSALWQYETWGIPNGDYNVAVEAFCPSGDQTVQGTDYVRVVPNGCQNGPYCTPVYRFYNRRTGVHFYTSNNHEKRSVLGYLDYAYEGISFYAETTDRGAAGQLPVHRFYNLKTGSHFYTQNQTEASYVNDHLYATYRYEGIAYYGYSMYFSPIPEYLSATDFTAPVHRFYKLSQGVHFYTVNQSEATYINNWLYPVYRYEGAAFYAIRNW